MKLLQRNISGSPLMMLLCLRLDLPSPLDESMQKCFAEGSGPVYRDVISWLQSSNTQLQLSGALAIANFARNGKISALTFISVSLSLSSAGP